MHRSGRAMPVTPSPSSWPALLTAVRRSRLPQDLGAFLGALMAGVAVGRPAGGDPASRSGAPSRRACSRPNL